MLLCCFGTIEIDVQYQIVLIYRNINENVCLSASVANFIFWLENEAYFPQENKHYTYTPCIKNVYKENCKIRKERENIFIYSYHIEKFTSENIHMIQFVIF